MARVERELLARWPESRLEPSLTRITALVDLLGSPHRAMPVIQVAGTNGKTTTARMVDELLRGFGLRVGRFTSPHLQEIRERIVLDGEVFIVQGEPMRDRERLVWTLDLRPE